MGANAVRAMPTAGTAREAIRRDARGAKATPVSRAQRQIATAFNPSNARPHAEAVADSVQADVGNDLEQGTHKSQPDDLPLRSGAIGAGGAVDIQRTTAAPLPVSNTVLSGNGEREKRHE